MATYKKLALSFSTADAEDVELKYSYNQLEISFKDWQEKNKRILFNNVLYFKWEPMLDVQHRNDESYEIFDSDWLSQNEIKLKNYAKNELGEELTDIHHFKLCFNVDDTAIDIICEKIEVIE